VIHGTAAAARKRALSLVAGALAAAALACRATGAQPAPLIRHDFTDSAQGWTVSGDTRPVEDVFSPTGGHPGGCITGVDEALGETWYFQAPDTVLRQLPRAVNGSISYSLKQSGTIISLFADDIVIIGPSGRLSYRFPTAPGTDWTDFSVRLSATAGWTWNWNAPATQGQIEQVLAAPTRLTIRGEFVTGDDMGSLDNFTLRGAAP
jgi:hypothetical protein